MSSAPCRDPKMKMISIILTNSLFEAALLREEGELRRGVQPAAVREHQLRLARVGLAEQRLRESARRRSRRGREMARRTRERGEPRGGPARPRQPEPQHCGVRLEQHEARARKSAV